MMEEEALEQLAELAAAIAKEMSESLKKFGRDISALYYAKQMQNIPMPQFPNDTEHKKLDNKKANEKLNKMMDEANRKWKYASENDKRKVAEMEGIVNEGQERIKRLYEI